MYQLWDLGATLVSRKEHEVAGRRLVEQKILQTGPKGVCLLAVRDVASGEAFALKQVVCRDKAAVAIAVREAELFARLPAHKNVGGYLGHAVVRSSETKERQVLILLELCSRGSLRDFLGRRGGAISERRLVRVFTDVAESVFWFHSQTPPIQLRELTLDGVAKGTDGTWKVTCLGAWRDEDFDPAGATEAQRAEMKEALAAHPAKRSCPPEMVDTDMSLPICSAADMWMLGCILYALMFNSLPFRDGEVRRIRRSQFELPARTPPHSSKLVDLLVWLLAAAPSDRPSARTLVTALWQWQDVSALELPAAVAERREQLLARANAMEARRGRGVPGDNAAPASEVCSIPQAVEAPIVGDSFSTGIGQVMMPEESFPEPEPAALAVAEARAVQLEAELAVAQKARDAAEAARRLAEEELVYLKLDRFGAQSFALSGNICADMPTTIDQAVFPAALAVPGTRRQARLPTLAVPGTRRQARMPTLSRTTSAPSLSPCGAAPPPLCVRAEDVAASAERCRGLAVEFNGAAQELSAHSGLVNQRLQWQALPDQLAPLGVSFARAAAALEAARALLGRVSRLLRQVAQDRQLSPGGAETFRELVATFSAALKDMERIKDIGILPAAGPSLDTCGEDQRLLLVWGARLRWEAELFAFQQGAWASFEKVCQQLEKDVGDALPQAVETSAAGGKGKAPPVMTKGNGKGTGKGSQSGVAPPKDEELDPVAQAASQRTSRPIFGSLTRAPDKAMLSNVKRPFATFVDSLHEHSGSVASIDRAFGGRGKLLIHACVANSDALARAARERFDDSQAAVRAGAPSSGKVGGTRFVQVVKGEIGPMGDKRRLSLELRFKRTSVRFASDLARAMDSLDFETYDCLAAAGHLDAATFIPALVVSADSEVEERETQKIHQAFLLPEEREVLAAMEASGHVGELHSLEKRLLPLIHVRSLSQKIKLFHVRLAFPVLERDALQGIQDAERACVAVCQSRCLLDVLGVTLQIATYLAKFGSIDFEEDGFTLLKLQHYEEFKVGKCHSLLSVLCAFLMNLRPRCSKHAGAAASSASAAPTPRRKGGGLDAERGASFIDRLEKDLNMVRVVLDKGLTPSELRSQAKQLEAMVSFVEQQLLEERALFEPAPLGGGTAAPRPEERFRELAAWAQGRRRLRELLEDLQASRKAVREAEDALLASERLLKEFAAVRESDMDRCSYIEIFSAVFQFVSRLQRTSKELRENPSEHLEMRQTLLGATPLQIVFSADCLAAAFDLWLRKAVSDARPKPWGGAAKTAAVRDLFRLFDTDGDDAVDAEELRVTVQAFGVDLPEDGDQVHHQVVRLFDRNRNGVLDFNEFLAFVEARTKLVFSQFMPEGRPEGAAISEDDLARVALRLGRGDVGPALRQQMIGMLDTERSDGLVSAEEFEQLILMRPERGLKGTEIDEFINRPLVTRIVDGSPSAQQPSHRSPRAWLLRGDPGDDGGSSSGSEEEEEGELAELGEHGALGEGVLA